MIRLGFRIAWLDLEFIGKILYGIPNMLGLVGKALSIISIK